MNSFSNSRFETYERCPRLFNLRYLEKRREPDSAALRKGSAIHAGIAAYDRHLVESELQTDVTWADAALVEADVAMSEEGRILSADEWEEVEGVVKAYIGSHYIEPGKVASIEDRLSFDFEGKTIKFVIDRMDLDGDIVEITDYKSDQRIRSQAEVNRDPQLRHYAWCVHKLYGYTDFIVALDFVRFGVIRKTALDMGDVEKAERRARRLIKAIEAEKEWAPTPGSYCAWCSFAENCPAAEGVAQEDPEALAGRILVLEAQLREAQAKLKEYCVENGPVVVGGEQFSYFDSHGLRATDVIAISRFMEMRGLDPADYFSINNKKLQSLLRDKVFAAEIGPYTEETISTSFRHKKAGGD